MEQDKRQRLLTAALLCTIVLILVLCFSVMRRHPEGDGEESSAISEIPSAEPEQTRSGKADSYRQSDIGSYWDALAEGSTADMPDNPQTADNPRPGGRPKVVEVDDLFGDCRDEPAQESGRPKPHAASRGSSGASGPRAEEKPVEMADGPTDTPREENPSSAAPTAQPMVKRSGAVSSLDEDISAELGSGFSTLDGTDRWVDAREGRPYRCMFTRDEKVRSGERITLRLLEDLVIGGVHIPRNTHLQGVVNISERLEVKVSSLDIGGRILALGFEAYDTDGGRGIYCTDLSGASKTAAEQAISTASSTLNSRLGRVARDAAAVGASIIRTRSGDATVSVPAGYTFYIIDKRQ